MPILIIRMDWMVAQRNYHCSTTRRKQKFSIIPAFIDALFCPVSLLKSSAMSGHYWAYLCTIFKDSHSQTLKKNKQCEAMGSKGEGYSSRSDGNEAKNLMEAEDTYKYLSTPPLLLLRWTLGHIVIIEYFSLTCLTNTVIIIPTDMTILLYWQALKKDQ